VRLLVTVESHFQSSGGDICSPHMTYERFWKRYRTVFDSVEIVARVKPVETIPDGWGKADGPGVQFSKIPEYQGPRQYLHMRRKVVDAVRVAIARCDAYILRVPGVIATQVWKHLPEGAPFGVEVVSIPWDALAPGTIKNIGRPFWRRFFHYYLKKQCQEAAAAAYVTEHAIQRLYPPSETAFTTNYSSVDLTSDCICTDPSERLARIRAIPARLRGDGPPVRLGLIGTFSMGHKRVDLHIEAFSRCVEQGANVEFEMIGDGSMLKDMKDLARRLGVAERVIFRGRIPGGKPILEALDNFDLFIHATATEGLPRVVIEAMARGCPCIGTDVGGIPELIEPDFLVPLFDSSALADKIMEVLREPKKMADAVLRNISHARNYGNDVLTPRRQAFYEALRERTERYLALQR